MTADVIKVARAAIADSSNSTVLGVRQFTSDIPLRSQIGNRLTRWLFHVLSGASVNDTQTALRAFSRDTLKQIITVSGDRYEYEMNVLLSLTKSASSLIEVPITTVYLDQNSGSHFRPIIDSMKIYAVLFRDLFIALSSFGLDIALFSIILSATKDITVSTFMARLVSGSYNFLANRHFVFNARAKDELLSQAFKYLALATFLAIASTFFVTLLSNDRVHPTLTKIGVDLSLYLFSFFVRKFFVFRK